MASIPALVDAAHYAYARLSDAQLAVEIELVHSPALLAACARQRLDAHSVRVEAALAILSGSGSAWCATSVPCSSGGSGWTRRCFNNKVHATARVARGRGAIKEA